MTTPEFVDLHAYVNPLDLQSWRDSRWLEMILETESACQLTGKDWPSGREWHKQLLEALHN